MGRIPDSPFSAYFLGLVGSRLGWHLFQRLLKNSGFAPIYSRLSQFYELDGGLLQQIQ